MICELLAAGVPIPPGMELKVTLALIAFAIAIYILSEATSKRE
jgi:hypothetical protein